MTMQMTIAASDLMQIDGLKFDRLLAFNITFKDLRSYHDSVCFLLLSICCHTGMPRSIHTQYTYMGQPVLVLYIDVERHTGIHNYPFQCLGSDPIWKSSPDLHHTPAVVVVVSQKLSRSVPYPPGLQPRTCGVRIRFITLSAYFLMNQNKSRCFIPIYLLDNYRFVYSQV